MSALLDECQLPRKWTKRALSVSEKETIINIYIASREHYPNETQTELVAFASRASGASSSSVYKILAEYKRSNSLSPPKGYLRARVVLDVSQETKALIRGKIHEFFFQNDPPTFDNISLSINEDDDLPDFKR